MSTFNAAAVARARELSGSGVAREIRLAAHLSLREMAAACDCSVATLWAYENHKSRVSARIAPRYLRVLDELAQVKP